MSTHSVLRQTYHFSWEHARTGMFLKLLEGKKKTKRKKNCLKDHRKPSSSALSLVTPELPPVLQQLWLCPSQVPPVSTSLAGHLPRSPVLTDAPPTLQHQPPLEDHAAVPSFLLYLKAQVGRQTTPENLVTSSQLGSPPFLFSFFVCSVQICNSAVTGLMRAPAAPINHFLIHLGFIHKQYLSDQSRSSKASNRTAL